MKLLYLVNVLLLGLLVSQCSNQSSTIEPLVTMDELTVRGSSNSILTHTSTTNSSTQKFNAGTLTAGEWDDLENWEFWETLIQEPNYGFYQGHWNIYPRQRYEAEITNRDKQPMNDLNVVLLNPEGTVLWEARTNSKGKATLWGQAFVENAPKAQNLELALAKENGKLVKIGRAIPFEEGVVQWEFTPEVENEVDKLEVLFVVDATGSMQDEIDYLKTELQDVVEQYKMLQPNTKLKLGSIFYRDYASDADYLMRTTPLSDNLNETFEFINQQNANGGGDFAEALEVALTTAVEKEQWSEKQAVRIAFLLLDAPAHHTPKSIEQLQKSLKLAASKGIRLIPIASSGVDKETEFLMRFFAILTGGTYVFITDHSGVGKGHIEPTVGTYEVQYLNDLLLNILQKYTKYTTDVVQ